MEIYAKKLREFYIREGVIPDDKIYIDTLRDRLPEDTIEKCVANKEIAGKFKLLITSFSSNKGKRLVERARLLVPLECILPNQAISSLRSPPLLHPP